MFKEQQYIALRNTVITKEDHRKFIGHVVVPKDDPSCHSFRHGKSPPGIGVVSPRLSKVYIAAEEIGTGSVSTVPMHALQSSFEVRVTLPTWKGSVEDSGCDHKIVLFQPS